MLSPNFVQWCNVVSDVVTTLASSAAAYAAIKHYASYLADKARVRAFMTPNKEADDEAADALAMFHGHERDTK